MTKKDFADKMAEMTGLSKADAQRAYDAFLEVAAGYLKGGEKVAFLGFGTFALQHKDAREARNPRDGKTIKVAAKTVVKFKAGKALSDAVEHVKVK